jgi:hypothetical protein
MGDKSGTCRFDCFQFSHTLVAVAFSYNVQQSTCTCEVDGQLQKLMVSRAFTSKSSRNKSSFLKYLHLFGPVRQSRAAVEPNLSHSQNTPPSADIHIAIHIAIH